MLLGFALGLERPRLAGILGIGLSLVGVGFIVYGGLEFAGTSLVGDALILAAAVFWGSYTVLSLGLLERYPPISLAAYAMTFGGLVAFPLSLLDPHTLDLAAIDATTWTAAAYSMLFSSAFGFAAWGWGVSRAGRQPRPDLPVPRHPDRRQRRHSAAGRELRAGAADRCRGDRRRRLPGEEVAAPSSGAIRPGLRGVTRVWACGPGRNRRWDRRRVASRARGGCRRPARGCGGRPRPPCRCGPTRGTSRWPSRRRARPRRP